MDKVKKEKVKKEKVRKLNFSISENGEVILNKRGVITGLILMPFYISILSILIELFSLLLYRTTGYVLGMLELNLIYYSVLMLIVLIFFGRYLGASFMQINRYTPRVWWYVTPVLGFLGIISLGRVSNLIITLLLDRYESMNNQAVTGLVTQSFWPMFIMTVVMAPIVEEVFYRAIVFQPLSRKHIVLAYLLSSLPFALMHVVSYAIAYNDPTELIFVFSYLPMAIVAAACTKHLKNIWGGILMHALNNLVAVFISTVIITM